MTDVLIVGAGIVGLSTAYWLTKAGHRVTVVEQGPIPCPLASSADHHRLIRYPYGDAEGYCARMAEGFAAWRAMWEDLTGDETFYYAATGMLCTSQEPDDYTDQSIKVMDKLGIPYERIEGADLAKRLPFLETANLAYGALSDGGALMANRILTDLATWLRQNGAVLMEHSPVTTIDADAGAVTVADGRTLTAGSVVVAAGIGTGRLLPDLGVELVPHRTVIVYAEPPEDLAEAYAQAPCWTDLGGDTDLWGMPAMDGLPMKFGNGLLGRRDPTVSERAMAEEEARRVMAGYSARFRGTDRFKLHWWQANYWTAAPDSDFVLERLGRVVAVSACSGHGFKFGALSGRDVSEAVTGDKPFDAVQAAIAARSPDLSAPA
ncbi:MAG: FAD-dependent oxidoreductase [Pseudomonadota bacterium]